MIWDGVVYMTAYQIGAIAGSLIGGALFGVIPLILGVKWGQATTGWIALFCCVVGSFFEGMFLSIPFCVFFLILETVIYSKQKKKNDTIQKPLPNTEEAYSDSPQDDIKYCFSCGKPISPESVFCPFCGKRIK